MEIKEFKPTENTAFNPPIKMFVWNDDESKKSVAKVCCIINSEYVKFKVQTTLCGYEHCAEIVEESQMMTYRQITEWLAKGNGEAKDCNGNIANNFYYLIGRENMLLEMDYKVRRWDSEMWEKATYDVYERDCIKVRNTEIKG